MSIQRKQLAALFFCSLVPWVVGNGLIPLLPVYAVQLGASSAAAGAYLAVSYAALAAGALSAGWVSGRFEQHKLPLMVVGALCVPVAWLMGRASTMGALTALTAALWFLGGLGLALTSILAGLSAGEHERGKVFGILALTGGLGSLTGSLGVGWLVDRGGYAVMFNVLAILLASWPLVALLLVDKAVRSARVEDAPAQKQPGLGKSFYLLFAASILTAVTGFFVILIRSVSMHALQFSPLEISSTGAVGGLIAMPFPLLMGWLSDRIGRKTFLMAGFLAQLVAIALLANASTLFDFWVVLALQGIANGSIGVGSALVIDLVSPAAVGKGLAMFASASWIGGVVGFASAGAALQSLGFLPTLIIGSGIALAAIGLLLFVQSRPARIGEPKLAND